MGVWALQTGKHRVGVIKYLGVPLMLHIQTGRRGQGDLPDHLGLLLLPLILP